MRIQDYPFEPITKDTVLSVGDIFYENNYQYYITYIDDTTFRYIASSFIHDWTGKESTSQLSSITNSNGYFKKVIFERPYDPTQAGDTDDDI